MATPFWNNPKPKISTSEMEYLQNETITKSSQKTLIATQSKAWRWNGSIHNIWLKLLKDFKNNSRIMKIILIFKSFRKFYIEGIINLSKFPIGGNKLNWHLLIAWRTN